MALTIGCDIENLTDPARRAKYHGAVEKNAYGQEIPKQTHRSINLDGHTSSTRKIICAVSELFDRIVDENLLVHRMYGGSRRFFRISENSPHAQIYTPSIFHAKKLPLSVPLPFLKNFIFWFTEASKSNILSSEWVKQHRFQNTNTARFE